MITGRRSSGILHAKVLRGRILWDCITGSELCISLPVELIESSVIACLTPV